MRRRNVRRAGGVVYGTPIPRPPNAATSADTSGRAGQPPLAACAAARSRAGAPPAALPARIGGDDDHRRLRSPGRTQGRDGIEAGAVVEMVVGQDDVGADRGLVEPAGGLGRALRRGDPAPPAVEQGLHAAQHGRLVVDAQDRQPCQRPAAEPRQLGCSTGLAAPPAAARPRISSRARAPTPGPSDGRAPCRCARRWTGRAPGPAPCSPSPPGDGTP